MPVLVRLRDHARDNDQKERSALFDGLLERITRRLLKYAPSSAGMSQSGRRSGYSGRYRAQAAVEVATGRETRAHDTLRGPVRVVSGDRPAVVAEAQAKDCESCPVDGAGSRIEIGGDAL